MTQIIDAIYPIGRTIICDHNPQTDYPWQTWTQDFKDRFPLGAGNTYTAGATGGEAAHTLTIDEMPSHGHGYRQMNVSGSWTVGSGTGGYYSGSQQQTDKTGGGRAHNNMPPYKAVMMWTRTA